MGFYRLTQIKLPLEHDDVSIRAAIENLYGLKGDFKYEIAKKSIDARKKHMLYVVYNVDAEVKEMPDNDLLKNVKYFDEKPKYERPALLASINERPVVVGSGPAGIFAGLILAESGLKPIIIERGQAIDQREIDVEKFYETGELNTESNIQFGEGGAGTYSDGKINTGVKDRSNRIIKIVDTFIEAGAPEEIRYTSKPHIGTDYLIEVVKNIRTRIIELGGEVRFGTKMIGLELDAENESITGVNVEGAETIKTNHVVLAVGHSARDTFKRLVEQSIPMEQKAFAVGLRIEHPQEMISEVQYGSSWEHPGLPVADYKLTHRTKKGRGVYSFCMCPGGFVVNATSEEGMVVSNGMSNFARDEKNANSAILVNVLPSDFASDDLLAGVEFQRQWERKAFEIGGSNYNLPVQQVGDFLKDRETKVLGRVGPNIKGHYTLANLNETLPNFVTEAIKESLPVFSRKIKGFDRSDALLVGVETRSSSPVRITRDGTMMSAIKGLYPCGEGAGYAGGIMSSALDGIKVAEAIISNI